MSLFGTHLDILEQGRQFSHTHWVDALTIPSSDSQIGPDLLDRRRMEVPAMKDDDIVNSIILDSDC